MKKIKQSLQGKAKKDGRKVMGREVEDVAIPVAESIVTMPGDYPSFLAAVKERIARERIKAVLAANAAMVLMYWDIGRQILEKQHAEGWGAKVTDRLSHDLKKAFPDMNGFSPRNLKYMRKFADCWPDRSIVQEVLALGQGFAFVGRQVHLEVGDSDFYIDLLFYHLKLRCYVVVELKVTRFDPGYISKLNMYLNVVDDVLRNPDDKPTIGLLLVKERNRTIVEYSLAGYRKPIGVVQWQREITRSLPEEFRSSLPTIEEIEAELAGGATLNSAGLQ